MKYVLIVLSFAFVVAGCKKKNSSESCTYTAGTTSASASEEAQVTAYLSANSITNAVELESSGLYYVIDSTGSSKKPALCSNISIDYKGYLSNGKMFDPLPRTGLSVSSATFTLGSLIEGWKRTIPLIGEGGKIKLFVPPSLAYGAETRIDSQTGDTLIYANSMLIFEIKLNTVY